MNKRFTPKAAAAVCHKLMDHSPAERELTHYPWTDAAGNQCYTDGYRVYRLREALADMPVMPDHITPPDLSRYFKPLDTGDVVEIPAPDAAVLREFIKGRPRTDLPFDLGDELPAANPAYMLDLLRLFPGGRWYVPAGARRETDPIFVLHDAGSALLLPCRKGTPAARATLKSEAEKAAERAKQAAAEKHAPKTGETEPATADTVPAWPTDLNYFIYARLPGEKKYYLADLGQGTVKVSAMRAPRYPESRLEQLKEALDDAAGENPGSSFQIRRTNGRTVVFTTTPTYTPEQFEELAAASSLSPEDFAAALAA